MTAVRHRTQPVGPVRGEQAEALDGKESRGSGPRGMWWVAWRQHRVAVTAGLAAIAVIGGAVFAYYLWLAAAMRAAGCVLGPAASSGCAIERYINVLTSQMQLAWNALTGGLILAPVLVGGFVGASVFAREFERGTSVFALTQSVGRLRWWATKSIVVGTPILAGLIGLGFLTRWVQERTSWFGTGGPLADGSFQIRGIMPAAFGLVGLAIALTAGIVIRTTVPALVVSLLCASTIVLLVGFPLRPHLLTPTRVVQSIGQSATADAATKDVEPSGSWEVGWGYVDANGTAVRFTPNCPGLVALSAPEAQDDPHYSDKWAAAVTACQQEQGIVARYTDYLPPSATWPLQLIQAAICAAIAALFLGLGYLRLRVLPGSRR